MRHFYSLNEFSAEQVAAFVDSALAFKENPCSDVLASRPAALQGPAQPRPVRAGQTFEDENAE